MELTHKAIARMAGYRVYKEARGYYWQDNSHDDFAHDDFYDSEDQAWRYCCEDCGLIVAN